jgi:beta-glucanase (GH16 family)
MTAQLTFDDEFNSLSLWNGSSGTWDTTFGYDDKNVGSTLAGNSEQEMYINANNAATSSVKPWTVNNGTLTLTAAKASSAISSQINGYQYTSGMINTNHSFSQEYGYFEMRAQLPAGQGLWPAFWLLPSNGSWPPEIDIMEVLGNDPSKLYTTTHTEETGSHTMSSQGTTVADMSSGYHTYGVDWEADKITFFFDGKQVYQVDTPADMHQPMYMIANLAVGGSWPGYVDGTTPLPANMNIDWIRAYSSDPYTAANPDSSNPGIVGDTSGTTGSTGSTVTAPAAANTLTGTANGDTLTGTADVDNKIRGGAGDDYITGSNKFNDINGNQGNDTIIGKSTVGDWLLGGQGNDSIDASASTGHNVINGNLGNDTLIGGSGGDTLRGGQGDDVIHAGTGNDWISGDLGNNTIYGGQGNDTFHAGGGHDIVNGWHNGDHVHVDAGVTFATTQVGADVHIAFSNGGEMDLLNTQVNSLQAGWIIN